MQPQVIKLNSRTIAEIRADGVMQKHISGRKHFLRKPHLSIAWDVSVLNQATQAGAVWAEVYDDDSGQVYHAAIADIEAKGFKINYGSPQIALPVSQWRKGRAASAQLQQLSLLELHT